LSKNSTKNSFTLHAQLHCLHTARRRASFLSCPGLVPSILGFNNFRVESSSSLINLDDILKSSREKKTRQFFIFRGWHCWGKRLDLTRGDLFLKTRRTPQRHRLCLIRLRGRIGARVKPGPI
jgi:hypothetical protein